MNGRRLRAVLVAAVLAGAMALSACTTTSSGGDTGGEQVLRYSPALFPVSLDAHQYPAEEPTQTAVQQVLETLVTMEDGEPVGLLAESFEPVDDRTWVLHLRDGVTFSDGTPLTARDVKASVERGQALEWSLAPLFAAVEAVEATDDRTVTFRTTEPLGTLPSTLSLVFIGPADRVNDPAYWELPVGTGPFVFESFTPDDRVVLRRNDAHWGEKATLDRVEIVSIPETAARITALRTGEVDVLQSIPPDQVSEVDGQPDITYGSGPSFTYYFTWFNSSRPPFDDVRVRQALWHALDLEAIIGDLFGDSASVARAPITQDVFGATALQPYPHDPDRARALLAEAGHADGLRVSMQWPRDGGPNIRALAQAMVSAWATVGVTVDPLEKERPQWLQDLNTKNFDLNLQTNTTGTGDADFTLARLYVCSADRNGYCNPELDRLLLAARASLDQGEREQLYAQAAQLVWDEAVGIFPADLRNNFAVRNQVQGFELPVNGRPEFRTVSIGDATGS
ncbi:ABC transporter substrate-binding protein [Pseudonocardia sichuanensis]